MRPEDVIAVERSWSQLRGYRGPMLAGLARRFQPVSAGPAAAARRARWLFDATEALVGLLAVPSKLTARASSIGATWPDPLTAPSFAVEGRAWMAAARDCDPTWSESTEAAWRQGWLLLSEVLAAEALAPFQSTVADRRERGGP